MPVDQNTSNRTTDPKSSSGLSSVEASKRLEKYGLNTITTRHGRSLLSIFLHQLNSPMMYLLASAAILSYAFGEVLDGTAIVIVIVINITIGFIMELQAERSMRALRKLVSIPAKVVRDEKTVEIPSEEVVPGDLLFVEAGDLVVADAQLKEAVQLQTEEGALTGESLPVSKRVGELPDDTPLAERQNMLFKGTHVTRGNGYAVVMQTGMKTELGKIAGLVQEAKQAATPLEKKLEVLSRKLIWVTLVILLAIITVGIIQDVDLLELITTAIALAVAAIPEGLPIVATLALARGMIKMAKHKVIIKRLSAVETLGGTDIICTDKTGTITQNRIEVSTILCPGGVLQVSEEADDATGDDNENDIRSSEEFKRLLHVAILCNTAEIASGEDTGEGNEEKLRGDPIETGLLRYAIAEGYNIEEVRRNHQRKDLVPFSSEAKMMLTAHLHDGEFWVAAKGALEEIIKYSSSFSVNGKPESLSDRRRDMFLKEGEKLAQEGRRVLAFAWKKSDDPKAEAKDLVYIGMIGFLDPPVEGIKNALAECRRAGIEVKMVTGDHPDTARTIASEVGLIEDEDTLVIVGAQMKSVDKLDAEQRKKWRRAKIFARVSPEQKLDLVRVLQEENHIVAMTGDGVNDAPALKKSDIGIAMGIRGTQVSQEVADMVLKDDTFKSIVRAIKQGRIIFQNIRKFVVYLLSCNLSELMVVASVGLLNFQFQLLPLQILFINLISDVLPALALGMSKGGEDVMSHVPRNPEEPIINKQKWISISVYAAVMAVTTMAAVMTHHYFVHPEDAWDPRSSNNILFLSLIGAQLIHVFNMNEGRRFFGGEEFRNKYIWWALVINGVIMYLAYTLPPVTEALYLIPLQPQDVLVVAGAMFVSSLINRILKSLGWLK